MRSVGDRIHEFFDNERAPDLLAKYYAGSYTGALFDLPPVAER
jgi:hypothetical protein